MSNSPVSITVPGRLTVSHIQPGHAYAVHIQVADTGGQAITVTATDGSYSKLAQAHPALAWVVRMTPQSFTLQPGASRTVTIVLRVPRSAAGQHAVNAVFKAQPVNDPTGNVQLQGAVASSVVLDLPGKDHPATVTARKQPVMVTGVAHHAPATATTADTIVGATFTLLVIAAIAGWVMRRRLRARPTQRPDGHRHAATTHRAG